MDNELKACPFCDGTATICKMDQDDNCRDTYCVHCDVCECSMGDESFGDYHIGEGGNFGTYFSEEEAATAWNNRVND